MRTVRRSSPSGTSLRRGLRAVALLSVLMVLLGACGGDDATDDAAPEGGLAAAQEEGEVTLYVVPQEQTVVDWVEPFESENGIEAVTHRQSQNALWEQWQQETRADQHIADIVIFNDPTLLAAARDEGWLAEYEPEQGPEYPDGAAEPGWWYMFYNSGEVLAWNTDQVSDDEANRLREEGFGAFLEGDWEGRIGTVAPQATDRVFATYHRLAEGEDADRYGWDLLEVLADGTASVYESAVPLTERLVAGEHAVVIGSADTIASRPAVDGAPIEFMYPDPTTASPFYMAISANAPHPAAARQFMEWATSEESLARVAEISGGIPAREDVEADRAIEDIEWFEGPTGLDGEWPEDDAMWDDQEDFISRWAELFGYQP